MYSRDEIKVLTDRVLNMTKADAVELSFEGGERSATRWVNSSITVNLVQYDQQLTLTVRHGQKQRSEEHTSELQSQSNLVCRLLLEKKKKILPPVLSVNRHQIIIVEPCHTRSTTEVSI